MTLVSEENPPQDIVSGESDNEAVGDCAKDCEPEKEDSKEEEINANLQNSFVNENKYILFWSCLFPLLKFCQICGKPAFITRLFERGSLLIVSLLCENNHKSKWYSQPRFHEMAAGNIFLAVAISYTGNTYQRTKKMMESLNISFFSHVSYNFIQKNYLFPAVHHIYTNQRQIRFDKVIDQNEIRLLGDGRYDLPGYSAKYGTYTVIESTSGEILDFQVCHSKIANNSARMELEGLKTMLQKLNSNMLNDKGLAIYRYKQIRAYPGKERPEMSTSSTYGMLEKY